MNTTKVIEFFKEVDGNKPLKEKFDSMVQGCKSQPSKVLLDKIVSFADKENFKFSSDDLSKFMNHEKKQCPNGELPDEVLTAVTGGGVWDVVKKIFDHICPR